MSSGSHEHPRSEWSNGLKRKVCTLSSNWSFKGCLFHKMHVNNASGKSYYSLAEPISLLLTHAYLLMALISFRCGAYASWWYVTNLTRFQHGSFLCEGFVCSKSQRAETCWSATQVQGCLTQDLRIIFSRFPWSASKWRFFRTFWEDRKEINGTKLHLKGSKLVLLLLYINRNNPPGHTYIHVQ